MGFFNSKEVRKNLAPCKPELEPTREPSSSSSDDIGKTSDFDEFFHIAFENESDEINIPATELTYPAPTPVIQDKETNLSTQIKWFEDRDPGNGAQAVVIRQDLDNHAKMAPQSVFNSFKELILYLETPTKGKRFRNEIMVRLILVWLSNQEIEQFVSEDATTDTPLGFLSLLGLKRSTYSTFFTLLCRAADVKCTQMHGICKAGDYQPVDRNTDHLRCVWNAVYIKDSWQIIHPFWVCRSVFGKQSGGGIKLEAGEKNGKRQHEAAGGTSECI